ncbi:MAG: TniQ family protein [Solirubrobacteraceae bacterium]
MSAQPCWPLHPPPARHESLSSWVGRVGQLYGLSVGDLLRHNLGPAPVLAQCLTDQDLDWDPPLAVLGALSERSGVPVGELRAGTIAGWVPWLLDSLEQAGQDGFETYVRQHSVLLTRGARPRYLVDRRWRPWIPEWPTTRPLRRVCPACASSSDRGTRLTAMLPLMLSCVEHGARLKPELDVTIASLAGKQAPLEPVSGAVAAMDRRTDEGLRGGTVMLPRRRVHVGLWFRLLRTLLDELTSSRSRLSQGSNATFERIWSATGHPWRAGVSVWRPYEQLDPRRQQQLLEAAATAMQLAETGAITARGTLGPLLTRESHGPVYEGDQSSQRDRDLLRARQELDAAIDAARTDPAAARQILTQFTAGVSLPLFERQRQFLINIGIPARFLPDARELGRIDLVDNGTEALRTERYRS